jgi:hypothetical protein
MEQAGVSTKAKVHALKSYTTTLEALPVSGRIQILFGCVL